MDKTKFTTTDRLITKELLKLNIAPQTFDEMCKISADFIEKHKETEKKLQSAFYVVLLAFVYNAGLKGGAV